jgi:MFS family permease
MAWHLGSLLLVISISSSVGLLLPIIARKAFEASAWQTLLVTAAPVVLLALSIFWGDVLRRTSLPRYLALYWAIAVLPLSGIAMADSFWGFATCHLIAACGSAAWPAVNGEVLKHLYPDRSRGRVYGAITTGTVLGAAAGSFFLGRWLQSDGQAFRTFMPMAAVLQGLGVTSLVLLLKTSGVLGVRAHNRAHDGRTLAQRVIEPLTHTREVLAGDRVFARYEAAFMTYGAAWMICEALRPMLLTDHLKLNYGAIGTSGFMVFQLAVASCTFLAGSILDKLGPARLCVLTFGLYPLYPIALALAENEQHLLLASIAYGVCTAGVNAGWMLGPVTLAPSPDKVPQYVAIHATMVGLRGTVFQFFGVWLYQLTGTFTASFAVAALCFAWASYQMWALHRIMSLKK